MLAGKFEEQKACDCNNDTKVKNARCRYTQAEIKKVLYNRVGVVKAVGLSQKDINTQQHSKEISSVHHIAVAVQWEWVGHGIAAADGQTVPTSRDFDFTHLPFMWHWLHRAAVDPQHACRHRASALLATTIHSLAEHLLHGDINNVYKLLTTIIVKYRDMMLKHTPVKGKSIAIGRYQNFIFNGMERSKLKHQVRNWMNETLFKSSKQSDSEEQIDQMAHISALWQARWVKKNTLAKRYELKKSNAKQNQDQKQYYMDAKIESEANDNDLRLVVAKGLQEKQVSRLSCLHFAGPVCSCAVFFVLLLFIYDSDVNPS